MSTFVSLFAGVGGFDLGLERAGHTCVGQVEIDKKCLQVLTNHWPDVPKHTDVVTAKEWADAEDLKGRVNIVCGGFPCQDVSVAGRRAGLAGERSGLFFDAVSFASHVQAETVILENVPGLLSSNQGRDFGVVLSTLADAGYSNIEWRVLNSQFFGVPQRRRRVFIVASTPESGRQQVFLEQESVRGDHSQSDTQGQDSPRDFVQGSDGSDQQGELVPYIKTVRSGARDEQGNLPPEVWESQAVSPTLTPFDNSGEARATVLLIEATNCDDEGLVGTLQARDFKGVGNQYVNERKLVVEKEIGFNHTQGLDIQASEEVFPTLRTGGAGNAVMTVSNHSSPVVTEGISSPITVGSGLGIPSVPAVLDTTVRRLTPVECERLQGFPDDWTAGQADGNRFKQMGNAVTVNVIEWIGKRL